MYYSTSPVIFKETMINLNFNQIKMFGISKIYKHKKTRITGIDFSNCGEYLICSALDGSIKLINVITGEVEKVINVKKNGVSIIKFTNQNESVLEVGLKKKACSVMYHSIYKNTYIRYFNGHDLPINNLSINPITKNFLTSSIDKTVKLWDLRLNKSIGLIKVKNYPVVNFDKEGLIFAVGESKKNLKLFDLRSFNKGAFTTFSFKNKLNFEKNWISLEFSNDNKNILINTNKNLIVCLDAFNGKIKHTFSNHKNNLNINLHACFTPDNQFIFCGSTNGDIHIWNLNSGKEVTRWIGHSEPVFFILWNPIRALCATAGSNLSLWIPKIIKNILKKN